MPESAARRARPCDSPTAERRACIALGCARPRGRSPPPEEEERGCSTAARGSATLRRRRGHRGSHVSRRAPNTLLHARKGGIDHRRSSSSEPRACPRSAVVAASPFDSLRRLLVAASSRASKQTAGAVTTVRLRPEWKNGACGWNGDTEKPPCARPSLSIARSTSLTHAQPTDAVAPSRAVRRDCVAHGLPPFQRVDPGPDCVRLDGHDARR